MKWLALNSSKIMHMQSLLRRLHQNVITLIVSYQRNITILYTETYNGFTVQTPSKFSQKCWSYMIPVDKLYNYLEIRYTDQNSPAPKDDLCFERVDLSQSINCITHDKLSIAAAYKLRQRNYHHLRVSHFFFCQNISRP